MPFFPQSEEELLDAVAEPENSTSSTESANRHVKHSLNQTTSLFGPPVADLDGSWMYGDTEDMVGTISNGRLTWSSLHATACTTEVTMNRAGLVDMHLGGILYTASFSGSMLRWSDGDIWCRVEEAQGQV